MSLSTNSLALDKSQPANHTISEARLLSDAKRGEPEAFEALCQTLRPRLLKIALGITRNREDAEDAVQDSMMRASVHLNDFHGNSSFSTWLTRIVMNSALMINRKNRSAREISADELPPAGEPGLHFQIPDRAPKPEQTYMQRERRTILHSATTWTPPAYTRGHRNGPISRPAHASSCSATTCLSVAVGTISADRPPHKAVQAAYGSHHGELEQCGYSHTAHSLGHS